MKIYTVLYTKRYPLSYFTNPGETEISEIPLYEKEIRAYSKEHAEQKFYNNNRDGMLFIDAIEKIYDGTYSEKCESYMAQYRHKEGEVCKCKIKALDIEHAELMLCRLMQIYGPYRLFSIETCQ